MRISRKVANAAKFMTDQLLPPIIRDSKLFGRVYMYCVFGKNYRLFYDFKEKASRASIAEIKKTYQDVYNRGIAVQRETDLNDACTKFILENTRGSEVLEVGCGRGALVKKLLKDRNNYQVSACDIALDKSLKNVKGAKFCEAPLESLPYKNRSFDTVITTHTLEHAYNLPAAISELRRVCRGKLIIVVPTERPYKYTPNLHLHFFPGAEYLINFLRGNSAKCEMLGGDLVYVEKL